MKQLIIPALLALMIAGCSSTPDGSEQDGAPVESRNSGVATVNAGGIDGRTTVSFIAQHIRCAPRTPNSSSTTASSRC